MQPKLPLSFVLSLCREIVPGKGEDSYCHSFCENAGLIGVFDGCGGAGARKHDFYSGHTEAYMASRVCAGAFYDAFREIFPCQTSADRLAQEVFAPRAVQRLLDVQPPKEEGGFQIKGTMIRTLPTTAALALIQTGEDQQAYVSAMWAGDSRVYLLDASGLAQLTVDDTTVTDPMETIYEDGILRNIFCSDRQVRLHCATFPVRLPFVVIAATDGCFGYVSTPMEFEGLLLGTLMQSGSPAQWESLLDKAIGSVAGDDHTLCLAAVGYRDFAQLQQSCAARYAFLYQNYLVPLSTLPLEDRQTRYEMWKQYRSHYSRYLKDGQE